MLRMISKKLVIVLSKLFGNEILIKYYRKNGIKIGENTHVFSNILNNEPYLIEIGDNTTISTNVRLITHDSSIGALLDRNIKSDLVGKVIIGNNCFIGEGTIILYGVTIGNKVIVGAGSVVTKSFPDNCIIAGNPAKIISTIDKFIEKNDEYFLCLHNKSFSEKKHIILKEKNLLKDELDEFLI